MNVENIRQLIHRANELEQKNHYLQKLIESQSLHHAIVLADHHAPECLLAFAKDYIQSVPDVLAALDDVSRAAGIAGFIEPLLTIAMENFAIVPSGLDQLLDKAYFTHRLIEEAADFYSNKTGSSLIPPEMTQANLIIHNLLGETFANRLDSIVDDIVSHLIRSQPVSHEQIREVINHSDVQQWARIWSELNGAAKNLGIELKNTCAA